MRQVDWRMVNGPSRPDLLTVADATIGPQSFQAMFAANLYLYSSCSWAHWLRRASPLHRPLAGQRHQLTWFVGPVSGHWPLRCWPRGHSASNFLLIQNSQPSKPYLCIPTPPPQQIQGSPWCRSLLQLPPHLSLFLWEEVLTSRWKHSPPYPTSPLLFDPLRQHSTLSRPAYFKLPTWHISKLNSIMNKWWFISKSWWIPGQVPTHLLTLLFLCLRCWVWNVLMG